MTTSVQRRRGSSVQHTAFTGLEGEITVDTTKDTAVVHDGSTIGGFPLAKESLENAKTTNLTAIIGTDTAADDTFLIYDASASVMKKITRAELNNAIEVDALSNVTITGGSINGTTIGSTTASTGKFTTLESSSTTTLNGTSIPTSKTLLVTTDIGTSVQAYDADLTTLGAGGAGARTFLGLGTAATTASTDYATAAQGAKADSSLQPSNIGTSVQAYDSNLTSLSNKRLFVKVDPTIVAWTKTGNGTATTSSILYIEVNGSIKTIASGTSITMPTLSSGTDYAIWAKTDGTLEATSNHTSPPTANARKIGGFHYAPGGNATAQSGGNTTPQINEYSFWDLKWRPNCNDPRGMTLVADGFWDDIYLANTDCDANGTSKYNVTIADGSSPPKVPTKFGGNGSTTYGSFTWFEACELASAYGKRLTTQRENMAACYGTTEASSIGSDQGSTILNAAYTSKWGVIQSTGVMWIWGDDRGGAYATGGWNANTEGRGSEYNAPNAVLLGGNWGFGALAGSRCSGWSLAASVSYGDIGVRFSCDHLLLD